MPNVSTPITRVRKALVTNESTATSFTSTKLLASFVEPGLTVAGVADATRCVFNRREQNMVDNSTIRVKPYGSATDNNTLSVKAVGWNRVGLAQMGGLAGGKWEWESSIICQVLGTMSSTLKGLAGSPVLDTEFFCDTLSLTYGIAVLYQGLADVDPAWFLFDTAGFEYIELLLARGTAADVNALVNF